MVNIQALLASPNGPSVIISTLVFVALPISLLLSDGAIFSQNTALPWEDGSRNSHLAV